MTNPKNDRDRPNAEEARNRAEAKFKKQQDKLSEGARATADYHAEGAATRKKTERLKAQRLAKEAAGGVAHEIADASPRLSQNTKKERHLSGCLIKVEKLNASQVAARR